MLYYKFKNFEEFKEFFGITKHGNGVESRKNKILLAYIKNKELLRNAVKSGDYELLHISNMSELKQTMLRRISASGENISALPYRVNILNNIFHSSIYETGEDNGLCEDGDCKAIRYINHDNDQRVFKMKAGKFIRGLMLETEFGKTLPEQVLGFLQEEIAQDWQSYTMSILPKHQLYVNDDFEKIYDSDECTGGFGSCMTDKDYHSFYSDYVEASAAYLANEEGVIIARTIIFNKVYDEDGKVWRLAERQYSTDGNNVLQRALIDSLIKGEYIDGYKQIGAGCADSRSFVDISGESLYNKTFHIECTLGYDDTLSYQDSFKWLNMSSQKAYNNSNMSYCENLESTEGRIGGEDDDDNSEYDSYHEEYVDEVTTVYIRGEERTCDSNNLGDFQRIDDDWYHDDDVSCCDACSDDFVTEDGEYSDITEEDYCCSSCLEKAELEYKEENWFYSEYDEEWFENESDIIKYMEWNSNTEEYNESTMCSTTKIRMLDVEDLYELNEVYYDCIDLEKMAPFNSILTIKDAA